MGFQFQHHHHSDFQWTTPEPVEAQSWALLATAGAISDIHTDAGGFGTWVRPILGRKVWYIGVNYATRPGESGWDKKAFKWQGFVLGPQDEL